ncbi:hypothetical protein [Streptomyces sp. NRRL B-1347]|uniref:hypothetical protein n=1 Tax=Streptomyces sp. NRRL B-1347 TaxID=1476877 RepID=UPI00131BFF90|nr:hypothetical protein [Streptomyces sp. NRRL B-1347]
MTDSPDYECSRSAPISQSVTGLGIRHRSGAVSQPRQGPEFGSDKAFGAVRSSHAVRWMAPALQPDALRLPEGGRILGKVVTVLRSL